jgi:hypothetical protein
MSKGIDRKLAGQLAQFAGTAFFGIGGWRCPQRHDLGAGYVKLRSPNKSLDIKGKLNK